MTFTYKYARPALTVDAVVFGFTEGAALQVLLIQRGEEPFRGHWALPGGFVHMDEDLSDAVRRELAEETGVRPNALFQLGAFGAPDRDPRGHVVSVAWTALVRAGDHPATPDTDAVAASWHSLSNLPNLAFDHLNMITLARKRLAEELLRSPIAAALLPSQFTLRQWQSLHEAVIGEPVDKRNFRKWAKSQGWIAGTGETQQGVSHRAAQLFQFTKPNDPKNNPLHSQEVTP